MYLLDSKGDRVDLDLIGEAPVPTRASRSSFESFGQAPGSLVATALAGVFELGPAPGVPARLAVAKAAPAEPRPVVFRERTTGLVRLAHREVVIRFRPRLSADQRRKLLKEHGLEQRRGNPLVRNQVVAVDRKREAPAIVELCNDLIGSEEVVFATPNFVSEYRRNAMPAAPPRDQWHLRNLGLVSGQKKGEDVKAVGAWKQLGRRAMVVAVLDDGVDLDHPNLKRRIWRNPDAAAKDRSGRDFFLPDEHPDHFNPRPKLFQFPFHQMRGNDIHGTPCAGVIAATGDVAVGVAPQARILAVKIFHADNLAQDERVADAIRYAATKADVLSCSWSGPRSTDIELAIEDAGRIGREGRGSAIFCASGNETSPVGHPAALDDAIAVGASNDRGEIAFYSNFGPELDFVAPSSGGERGILTTDVANPPGRGFNVGAAELGGADGLHTNDFGGTSSATPLAAGVAALLLSIDPTLTRDELREVLKATAEKIPDPKGYGPDGRNDLFGHGRIDAERASAAVRERKDGR
ncbi:MAG TPA: S8 family serine peptidase [Solirubrobacteraceae bacterium]|nr:S8 family serine peptidase [Solirubrobacteraceae bacterium]